MAEIVSHGTQLTLQFEEPVGEIHGPDCPYWIKFGWLTRHPIYGHPSEYPPADQLGDLGDDYTRFLHKDRKQTWEQYVEALKIALQRDIDHYESLRAGGPVGWRIDTDDWPEWMHRAHDLHYKVAHITWHRSLIKAAIAKLSGAVAA